MTDIRILQTIKSIFPHMYIIICSILMSLYGTNNPFQIGYTNVDSSVFCYVAKIIVGGGMPYRDTFDHKGPLIYLIDALGLLIDEEIGIWILELLTIYVIFLFAYKIAKYVGCSEVMACCVISLGIFALSYFFEGGNLTEEYACLFITVSFFIFLKFFSNQTVKIYELIICGAFFAAVCLLRVNMIALWIVMCLGIIFEKFIHGKACNLLKIGSWFLVGIFVVIIPVFTWLIINNAFDAFIDDYIIFNFLYSSDSKRAALVNILGAIQFFLFSLPVVISFPCLLFYCVKYDESVDRLCAITLVLSIVMSCVSGQKYLHYGIILYPFLIYSFARFFPVFNSIKTINNIERNIKTGLAVSFICVLSYILFPFYVFFAKMTVGLFFNQDECLVDLVEGRKIANVIQSYTNLNDKITVCGNGNIVYLLSNRQSISKYSYQDPIARISPIIWNDYLNSIRDLKPKIIVTTPKIESKIPFMDITSIIKKNYKIITEISGLKIYYLKDGY